MNNRKKIGQWGEKLAGDFLAKRGFEIIEQNYYCQEGEVDIVAKKDEEFWFIEVKTRLSTACGEPEEAVDQAKEEKMAQVALDYLAKKEIVVDTWQLGLVSVKVINKERVKLRLVIL